MNGAFSRGHSRSRRVKYARQPVIDMTLDDNPVTAQQRITKGTRQQGTRGTGLRRLPRPSAALGAVVAVGGLLVKLAQKNYATEDVQTDESLDARVPTPAELEFAAIVRAAAEDVGKIMSVSTNGFTVEAKIRSNSGRGTWTAHFEFDEETGHCRYSHPYQGATAPLFFIEKVQRRLSEAAAT
ncbi:hypothetical protein IOD14_20490 [Streptomyces sp. A2-16]|uniref:hypothetical protein n=1 Tax=Streptomyces sp. A2-16 TaxID=2781734 RepID=UPI001BB0078A|nr:hypothetical protein [Streptomyces sp. A2-16]QUC58974.1 hypothetical protein IOD14_20490 [Streptomyces sp. A2-16]